MKRLILLVILISLIAPTYNGQSAAIKPSNDDTTLAKFSLLSDLQALEAKSTKLGEPLARARAKAEIADAAWRLDEEWAKKLLSEAYELTLPDEEEQDSLRSKPAGTAPVPPTAIDRARNDVCNRVLQIAGRDKAFAHQLVQLAANKLGKYEEHFRYAVLASQAISGSDKEAASKYIIQAIEADPTLGTAGSVILDIATQDRALADNLIIQYIERLRAFPLATSNRSTIRVFFALNQLIFSLDLQQRRIAPPSPAVMRAYVSYMIETLGRLEQSEPGYLRRGREILLAVWPLLERYAPELTAAFFELEKQSRNAGDDASLPTLKSMEEAARNRYETRLEKALASDQADEVTINSALSRGDFNKARKLIDKIKDSSLKTQLTETANMREALHLAVKGDLTGAEALAEQLNRATSILQVHPVIIEKCAVKKDQTCVTTLVYRAVRQLKHADIAPPLPPPGLPASVMVSSQELDPILVSLCKLAKSIIAVNETLALEVLDEAVSAANKSIMDTGQGRTGIEADIFRKLAPINEPRARQAAEDLEDPLRQIVALAGIYQWKAEELTKKAKPKRKETPSS